MNEDNNSFDLNEKQLEEIQQKYAHLEPLLDEYLSPQEKQQYRETVCESLQISERTLRRYLQLFKEHGVCSLTRKQRSDAGQMRVFSEQILTRAKELLVQNDRRSIPMLMELLRADAQVGELAKKISPSTLYFHLIKTGHKFRGRNNTPPVGIYRRFEAEYANQLWQGDARHGIPLPHPTKKAKRKMTYLFGWADDFSRKIMGARYYWDATLPRLEDIFRRSALRWGLAQKLYCDNGKVYISKHFLILVSDLGIKKIHHRAYAAWCKGKVVMRSHGTLSGPSKISKVFFPPFDPLFKGNCLGRKRIAFFHNFSDMAA